MARMKYEDWKPAPRIQKMLLQATEIIEDYQRQGFTLTLRQLYYQFVAKDLIPNTQKSYKRLGDWINRGRLAGWIDWEAIEDRLRTVRERSHWDDPSGIINSCVHWWGMDLWEGQARRVEVWIEKDALIGVAEPACEKWDVALVSCRGYNSQSAMWRAGQRFNALMQEDENVLPSIIYLGDHDPSGLQMAEDIGKRMEMFTGLSGVVKRIALTRAQIDQYDPPPNPAKETDSRFKKYHEEHGDTCWELDALSPKVVNDLIEREVKKLCDMPLWTKRRKLQEMHRRNLGRTRDNWTGVERFVKKQSGAAEEEE